MTNQNRIPDDEADQLPSDLIELGQLISRIEPVERRDIDIAFERVTESVRRRRRILNLVQEALSQLRLNVKYLTFDLEITRKERDELQAQIEEEDRGF
ncbi:MAG: transcriptional regulator [Fuerstiella sp.]|nr:transcriptional regulator [Fuerstiella sp.]